MASTPSLFSELSFTAIQEAFPSPHPAIGAEQASLFSQPSDPSPSSSTARPKAVTRPSIATSDEQDTSVDSVARGQRKRKRNFTNADRVVHSVIEKQRREAFNERLQYLADLIPELQELPTSQLFKTVVVNASATYHQRQTKHLETCLLEIEALQRRCANLQQTVSTLSGCNPSQLAGPSLSSAEFARVELEIRKDLASLQQASRARASSTSTNQSAHTEASEGPAQATDMVSIESQASDPTHVLADASLAISAGLFAASHFETSSTNADFAHVTTSAEDLAALERILPGLLPGAPSAMMPACETPQVAVAPMPFPWESFSPGNFFYRQLLEARERT
ncbi:Myc-type, basic helix-loop-helix (bHLH) domain protein [Kalmanozyma brasiliensis GHG001]|uniref:Myc-type, basic helix-loop-helix (bHLH) domain protein n=1 Tax=Kalmanozyma brasiliensis (strain GHG001) TaxID=1365824 RepID=UPI002867D84D|nr:Myc-type, basic helix-loop-helix (bHLH) domain protein [Kalmanozyma brasiliensis GHG001]KAF6767545.1 Myc-type, basic helix-loop-helix (bHLH) domain protein [Kalmanozyma brasiliensis GHG001]